jgi:HK97 family phage major capsid protein
VTLAELRARLDAIAGELRAIDTEAGDAALTADQTERFDGLLAERATVETGIATEERREATRSSLTATPARVERTAPEVIIKNDPFAVLEDRSVQGRARTTAVRDGILRSMEDRVEGGENQAHFERLLKRHGDDHKWAENLLARSREEYASAFAKLVTGREASLTPEERAAIAVGTNTAGGYLTPTHLDPTLLLTNSGSSNVMRQYAKIVTLTEGSIWNGVTTAGVTASWDGELVEVSDDSPAVARVSITAYKAQGFIQASVDAFDDIAGLTQDVLGLFADAKDRLEGAAHMTGNGTSAPKGLFTALNASSSLQTTSTTAATIGEVDIHALYRALPVRWRGQGSWVMNPLYALAVKRLGTAVSSSFSGDLTQPVTDRILGRPVIETDDAPTTQTTTALDNEIAFAKLDEYTIVDKPGGTSIEFIPHLFNVANNLPDGRRGWFMYWRTGGDVPNLAAARLLVDKTSA